MADQVLGIAPQKDTHTNWVSANPTLGKDSGGKSYGQIILSTDSPIGDILVWGNDQTYNVAYAAGQYLVTGTPTPPGCMLEFGGTTAPSGYLLCDGSAVSRTTYAALFAAIGTLWGVGDGSTTFNLPDRRGTFGRGTGSHGTETMADGNPYAGPAVGAFEDDQMQGHRHGSIYAGAPVGDSPAGSIIIVLRGVGTSTSFASTTVTDGTNGTPRTGDETRPFAAGVTYIIKT